MTIRPATVADVPALFALIKYHADRQRMILRTLDELYAQLREFVVADAGSQVVGCAAAHIFWSDLAELKCVAVRDDQQRRGVGARLCDQLHRDLRALGVSRAFVLTGATPFFERLGYRKVDKESLPRFIWGECVRCPSFPICNEDALVLPLLPAPEAG